MKPLYFLCISLFLSKYKKDDRINPVILCFFNNINKLFGPERRLHHAAHSAHAAGCGRESFKRIVALDIDDTGFCRQEHCRSGSRILERRSRNLRRVYDTFGHHVHVFFRSSVETDACFASLYLGNYDRTFQTCIFCDLSYRFLQGSLNDSSACLHIAAESLDVFCHCRDYIDESSAAARDDTFFNGCLCCVQGIFDSQFLFLQFGFRQEHLPG